MRTAILAAAAAAIVGLTSAAPAGDKIQALPDCGPLPTPMYSGYLQTSAPSKQLHYYFVTSASAQAAKDPVLIWLNGGPGCSSLLGAFSENGPFTFDDGQQYLKPNLQSWHARANVLYIESPAHIGFSIGGPNDWNFTDLSQSIDLFAAVQYFFVQYPEYLANPLWISGESYAGVYGPYLAYQIHTWNQAASMYGQTTYNLKGFAIGNGITDWTVDAQPATFETFEEMNLMPPSLYAQFAANDCHYDVAKPFNNSVKCSELEAVVDLLIAGLNPYDLFRTTYGMGSSSAKIQRRLEQSPSSQDTHGEALVGDEIKRYKRSVSLDQYTPWVKHNRLLAKQAAEITFGDPMADYLNRADVRAALHIPLEVQAWEGCTTNPLFNYPFSLEASIWIYTILRPYGYTMMHYSGDTDGVVPTIGTRRWIESLGWPVTTEWQPWTTDGQVSGYTQTYGNFYFTTVHGVGHMAPQWKKKDMHMMILKFIHGESFLSN